MLDKSITQGALQKGMGMSLCQNFRHLINALVTILILSVGGLAQAQLDEAPSRRNVASTQADYEVVNQLLSQFALATPQQQSSIVVQLAPYKYDDVARSLIKILDFQFKSNNTNTFIVNAAIDSLNGMADSSYSPEIQLLIQQINQARYTDQKLSNDKTFNAIFNKLNLLATTASNNQQALPKLQVPVQPKTQNNVSAKANTKNQNPDFSVPLQEKIMDLVKQMGPMLPPELTAFISVRPDYLTDEALEDRAKNDSYR